jgi:hypothetical protein
LGQRARNELCRIQRFTRRCIHLYHLPARPGLRGILFFGLLLVLMATRMSGATFHIDCDTGRWQRWAQPIERVADDGQGESANVWLLTVFC